MYRRLPDLVLMFIFILMISIPLFSPLPASSLFRNPDLPSQTGFSASGLIKALVDFPSAFNEYFNHHYLFYQQQVDAFQALRFHLLHEKIFPNVLIGKQDWLYYTGEDNISDYECTSPFTRDELQVIQTHLLGWNDQLQQRGIRFYVVIAPNKETIYPQYLPDEVSRQLNACRIDQVMRALRSTPLAVLDLRAAMQTAVQSSQVYHRTDTHWNDTGALLAAREMLALFSRDFPQLTIPSLYDYRQEIQSFSGDLAKFLPADDRFVESEIALIPILKPSAILEEGSDKTIISYIPGSDLPSAVIFRDSFADALVPYLSEHFSRVVYSHSFSVDLDLVDRERPDIVIYEITQRYLIVLH